MNFDLSKYPHSNTYMYCETEKERDEFSKVLDAAGRKWQSRDSYLRLKYPCPIYFGFNMGMKQHGRPPQGSIILNCKDFLHSRGEF